MMTCEATEPRWVAYHAGATDPVERAAIDGHLLGCTACLRLYLDAKNASEDVPLSEALPHPEVRARLRDEVRRWVPAPVPASRSRRAILVGAAVAALALLATAFALRAPAAPPVAPILIDSDQAESSLSVL